MKQLEMIRISKNGLSWGDVWITEGSFNIYKKLYERRGYYVKRTLVKKQIECE